MISRHITGNPGESVSDLSIEIFGILWLEDRGGKNPIIEMKGEWFDLNGNVIRLFSLVEEVEIARKKGQFLEKKLSEAIITQSNFAARMGEVLFKRVG